MELSKLGKAAYFYAEKFGWYVFPTKPKSKEPATKNGFHDATTNLLDIYDWWIKYPHSNVGIRTGKESGFIVIDVDGEEGVNSLQELIDMYGGLPDTVESITGSGGKHIFFKYPSSDIHIPSRVGLYDGLDIRANGGYIVAPPSIHPNGNFYEWELSSRPTDIEIAEPPEWLLALLVRKNETIIKKSSNEWHSILNGVSEGGRNSAATSLAGHLMRKYVDVSIVCAFMEMWNERNNPPLSSNELTTIIKSVARIESERRKKKGGGN